MVDPVFFLHHTQVDRLWWLWQKADFANRAYEYSGVKLQISGQIFKAALNDTMLMLGMAKDLPVRDIMTTETELLCYGY